MSQTIRFSLAGLALLFAASRAFSADDKPPVVLREILSALSPSNVANPASEPQENPYGSMPDPRPILVDDSLSDDATIKLWEEQSANTRLVSGSYSRSEFNDVFHVEKVVTGKFTIETPYRWRLEELPVKIKKGEQSTKQGKKGESYERESGTAQTWIWTDEEVIFIDVERKTYQSMNIPKEFQRTEKALCPLPARFFFDAKAIERKFTFVGSRETNDDLIILAAPMNQPTHGWWRTAREDWIFQLFDVGNCERAAFRLDKTLARPTKVALWNVGNMQTIYTFENVVLRSLDDQENGPFESGESVFNEEMLRGLRRIGE